MYVSPTGRSRNAAKLVPVRFNLTVTVLFLTSDPMPPSRSKPLASAARASAPYERHETIATLAFARSEAGKRLPAAGVVSAASSSALASRHPNGAPAASVALHRRNRRRLRT